MAEATPKALALAKLRESGLTAADARRLRLSVLDARSTPKLDPTFRPYPALMLPYFDLRGRPTKFYRLRYLGQPNGFDALRKKPYRYVQVPGSTNEVYLPPFADWPKLAKDPTFSLFVTEGELKAACAGKLGFPTLGLGGVDAWRAQKKGHALLPVFREFAWEGRTVYLVFDSDYSVKPGVMRALLFLAKELTALGARPALVALPDLPGLEKTGLDDFLVAKGKPGFLPLIEAATPFSYTKELWALNSEIAYVRDPGLVLILADGRRVSAAAFKEHAFANRHYHETLYDKAGEAKLVKKPIAPAWLGWEHRAELVRLTYKPGEPRLTEDAEWNHWPGWGCEPRPGPVKLWHALLDFLFTTDRNRAHRDWFERWLAYPIQHPGTKLYSAAVLWGATQGTGKSLVGYSLAKIYGTNWVEISDEDLAGTFNEWAQHKQFVLADDVTGAEYKKTLMDRLKGMITRQRIRINTKYVPSYEVPDCLNYYFTSQHPDAFLIDDTDRRYFIHEAPAEPLPKKFYQEYDAWYKSAAGAAALFHHLRTLDLGDFNPRVSPPLTQAKVAMIADSKSDLGSWVAQLKEHADQVLRIGDVRLKSDLYTNTQLLALYDPSNARRVTANGLGRELKKAGFRYVNGGATVQTTAGPQRLYAVRNQRRWAEAKPHLLSAHYNEAHAAPDAKEKF